MAKCTNVEDYQGIQRDEYKLAISLPQVVGVSPHNGFYMQETKNKETSPATANKSPSTQGLLPPLHELMHHSDVLVQQGQPKRALRLLIHILEDRSDELLRETKLAFHRRLSALAFQLSLLE